jgi:hypothetical protein
MASIWKALRGSQSFGIGVRRVCGTLGFTESRRKDYAKSKDVDRDFGTTHCSTACPLLGVGWTLGRHAVSDHARSNTAAVFGVVGDGPETLGRVAKREVLHAEVKV